MAIAFLCLERFDEAKSKAFVRFKSAARPSASLARQPGREAHVWCGGPRP
jgi:hypothetical protein